MSRQVERKRAIFGKSTALIWRPEDWCWIIGGDETRVYSSQLNKMLSTESDEYLVWQGRNGKPTRIKTVEELKDVLAQHGLDAMPRSIA